MRIHYFISFDTIDALIAFVRKQRNGLRYNPYTGEILK